MAKTKTPSEGWRNRIVGEGMVAASELVAHPQNWRKHPASQGKLLGGTLDGVGWVQRVIVNRRSGRMLDGHLRAELARQQGPETPVPVVYVDLSDDEERVVLATLDPIAGMAIADEATLAGLVRSIEDADLRSVAGEIAQTLNVDVNGAKGNADAEPQVDRAAELNEKWQVKPGDLWRVGEHRLICGDCTDASVVERVMGGERADCVITSPPYLNQRKYTADSELSDWDGLMSGCFSSALCTDDCQVFVNLGMVHDSGEWSDYWSHWVDWMRSAGWKRFGLYVWDQGAGLPGDWAGRLAPAFEFVFHFNKQSRRPEKWIDSKLAGQIANKRTFRHDDGRLKPFTQNGVAYGDTKIPDSVIRVNRQIGDTGHPAPYSEAFVGFIARTYSRENQIIYEPFLGSGTTMVACENLGRRCRAVEIAPGYCAVALERMATAFAGIVIERVGNGEL